MHDLDLNIQLEPDGFIDKPQSGSPFDTFVILLDQKILQQIRKHSELYLSHEMGGLLIGEIWENHGVTYVTIKESLRSQVQGTYATLSFTIETWIELEQQRETLFPQYKKVGWYHSHLGYGVFLSPLDKFLHQSAFSLPWHIALVYDPILSEFGFFRWHEGELIPAPFYLTSDNETFQDTPMSRSISHQLQVLSNYLEDLPGRSAIVEASRHLRSRLEQTSAEQLAPFSPVEDTFNTVIEMADIDTKALRQAKNMLKQLVGQQLLLQQNVHHVSSFLFENEKLTLAQKNVYFIENTALSWHPLNQASIGPTITLPTPPRDITANERTIFLLDHFGAVYVVPFSTAELTASSLRKKQGRGAASIEVRSFMLAHRADDPLRTIIARGNKLYLSSKSEVWILMLDDEFNDPLPKIFNLATIKSTFPIQAEALAVDAQENIYIADIANSRVLQMKPNGRIKYVILGGGRFSLVTPISLCISGNELYILDLYHIIVYNLDSMTFVRHYNWGEFVGNKAIHRLYTDEAGQVYFSAGRGISHRLYRLDSEMVS